MSKLLVGTRKGLFSLSRGAAVWDIDGVDFLGDPVSIAIYDAATDTTFAALTLGHFGAKLRRKTGEGPWEECAVPTFPQDDEQKTLKQIWALTPDGRGGLWAGTIPAALFHSADGGRTWTLNGPLWREPARHKWLGGGTDEPGMHSVCVHPNNPDDVVVGISCGGVWRTTDGGRSWACRCDGMVAEYMPEERAEEPEIQDPHRVVQCESNPDVLWVQHHNGIFVSRDRATRWTRVTNVGPSQFGFGVAVHPRDGDTAWFVPGIKDACRIPVDGRLVVTRTTDGGRTGASLSHGLPDRHCYDLVFRHALDLAPDGRTLAFGSTTGNLWISENGGDQFQQISAYLPPVYCVAFG